MRLPVLAFLLLSLCLPLIQAQGQSPRIVGGSVAPAGAYPWMVGLLNKHDANLATAQECGGSLIHPYWVMTAAHCVEGLKTSDIQVVVGATDLNAPGLARIDVIEVIRHPVYRSTGYDYDIALLLLAQPVTNISPVEIIDDPALVHAGVMGTTMGWGTLTNTATAGTPILHYVQLPIIDQAVVNQADHLDGQVTDKMFAAGLEEGGADTCAGDSGGPLVIRGRTGQWVQAGIVSWGLECGLPKQPGVYTRVSKIRQWIQSYVWPNFASWESAAGVNSDNGPDVDGDKATQWLEYALRSNPLSGAEAAGYPRAGTEIFSGKRYPTLTVRRPAGGGDLTWRLEGSTDLAAWTPLDPAAQQSGSPIPVPGDAGAEQITWRGLEGQNRSFLRAVVKPGAAFVPSRRTLAFPAAVTHALHSLDTLTAGFRIRDYYLTGVPAGQNVTITLRSDDFDSVLRLINAATGAVIATSSSNSGSGNDEKLSFTATAGIEYAAEVTTQTAGNTGEFTLAVFQLPAGNLSISGSQTISNGALATTDPVDPLFTDAIYYKDDYQFAPTAATTISVFMSSAAFDPSFSIINAETNQLMMLGTGVKTSTVTPQYTGWALQSFTPRPGVTYFLRASSNSPAATGAYTIKTANTPTITTGQTKTGSLANTDGVDSYHAPTYAQFIDDFALIGVTAGAIRTITVSSTGTSPIDNTLEILDATSGESVDYADDEDPAAASVLDFTPQAGHSYIIRVGSYERETGGYTLRVQ